jgi:hypothetical protein
MTRDSSFKDFKDLRKIDCGGRFRSSGFRSSTVAFVSRPSQAGDCGGDVVSSCMEINIASLYCWRSVMRLGVGERHVSTEESLRRGAVTFGMA